MKVICDENCYAKHYDDWFTSKLSTSSELKSIYSSLLSQLRSDVIVISNMKEESN